MIRKGIKIECHIRIPRSAEKNIANPQHGWKEEKINFYEPVQSSPRLSDGLRTGPICGGSSIICTIPNLNLIPSVPFAGSSNINCTIPSLNLIPSFPFAAAAV
jgi:hypothetical protein